MIVLDSSFLIAFHNTRDGHHAAASRIMVQFVGGKWGRGLLLEYVFLETVTAIKARMNAATATSAGTTLLEAVEIDFVPCSEISPEHSIPFVAIARTT